MTSATARVLLIGAGHAHVEVLRQAGLRPQPQHQLVLAVDCNPSLYSGMLPGWVAGQYRASDLSIDAAALARRAGALVVLEAVCRVDAERRRVVTASGRELSYDLASLDVGSGVTGMELPGALAHGLAVRPIQQFLAGAEKMIARARAASGDEPFRLLVVGAGAGGVELAFCFEARLRAETSRRALVTLVDRAEAVLPGAAASLAHRIFRAARRRGIRLELGVEVEALESRGARLRGGRRIEADAVLWSPGPAAHPFLRDSGLPVDARGFVRIRPTFQVEGFDRLFAIGDCASLAGMKKAGVYAVRGGPILAENLRRQLAGRALGFYRPQRDFLSLLNVGDGAALGAWRGISFEGRSVMRLKDWIDRRFMGRYR